jgi:tetratricopeptide (TPR) repeat protein
MLAVLSRQIGRALFALCFCICADALRAQNAPATRLPPGAAVRPDLPPEIKKAAELFQRATLLQRDRKYTEAIAAYMQFLQFAESAKMPADDRAAACLNLLQIHALRKDNKSYDKTMQQLARINPPRPDALMQLALYASRQRQVEKAVDYAQRALTKNPPGAIAAPCHFILGAAALARNDAPAAEKAYRNVVRFLPKDARAHFNLGIALGRQRKYKEALQTLEKVRTLDPKLIEAPLLIAALKQESRDYVGALAACEQALQLQPRNQTALFGRALILSLANKKEQAITAYNRALEIYPNNPDAQLNLAQLYFGIGNFAGARRRYETVSKLLPKDYRPWYGMALCDMEEAGRLVDIPLRKKTFDQSEANLKRAIALAPNNSTLAQALTQLYERSGRFDDALTTHLKRMKEKPEDVAGYQGVARVYLMQRNTEKVVETWKKYRARKPNDPISYLEAARAYELTGRWEEANKEWSALLAKQPKDGSALLARARNLTQLRDTAGARKEYEAVLALDPQGRDLPGAMAPAMAASAALTHRLEALRGLALLEQSENRWEAAIGWWQKVKTLQLEQAEKTRTLPDVSAFRSLAYAYEQLKLYELAAKEYEAMAQANPKEERAYAEMGRLYEQQEKLPEAAAAYRKAAERAKEPLDTLLLIPALYRKRSQFDMALREYEMLLPKFSKETRLLSPMAQTYEQAGLDDKALKTYDALLQVDPQARWAEGRKAIILLRLKRYEEARLLHEKALERNPEDYATYADLARIYREQDKSDLYLNWLQQRLEKRPTSRTLLSHLLDTYLLLKREEEGWKYIAAFMEQRSKERPVLENYAGVLNARSKTVEATEVYRKIAALVPKDLEAQVNLVDQLDFVGQKDEATRTLEALTARPDWTMDQRRALRRRLADRYVQAGRAVEAIPIYEEAVKANPNDFVAASTLAQTFVAAGRETEAIPLYQNLVQQMVYPPEVRAQIRSKMGGIYEKKGSKKEAVMQYREALKLNPKDKEASDALKRLGEKE